MTLMDMGHIALEFTKRHMPITLRRIAESP
jgi:hypothetical protein